MKNYEDSIYGLIEIEPIFQLIINTPEFQRLKYIKQTENIYFLFPSSVHTRFEHCIGTFHLAKKLLDYLSKSQHDLNITRKESLCVQIAALCHDIGHGPFSHLFEELIKPNCSFKHETASFLIFERIFDKLKSQSEFIEEGIFTEKDKILIIDLIHPKISKKLWSNFINQTNDIKIIKDNFLNQLGISMDKIFLFEIVSNFITNIDVDKWDYFTRDSFHMNLKINFDYEKFIHNCYISELDGLNRLCFKDLEQILDLIKAKRSLQKYRYKIPSALALRLMLIDCLNEITLEDGFINKLENLKLNLNWYLNLDDRVLDTIRTHKGLEIKSRMDQKDFYHYIRSVPRENLDQNKIDMFKQNMAYKFQIDPKDLIFTIEKYFFGKNNQCLLESLSKMNLSTNEARVTLKEETIVILFYKPITLDESLRDDLKNEFIKFFGSYKKVDFNNNEEI
ncbi:unnamed protein product [Brachionus calyciflorus]|uniref:HD/PDEase domain-containing protein n=1 Tax=Brachionus calyciflorus TaxID=104777 RepID=A0A814IN59_9BILA|nr:unnamed protein product [Brachionus calyciflorus]